MLAGFFVASVNIVRPALKSAQSTATASRLPLKSKLRKMLHELKIDSLSVTALHKQQLLLVVAKYLDIFAECDSDVGTTNLTFYDIDTGDVLSLCQLVRRLFYCEIRAAVESEIDNRVSADIARASTSLWAFLIVMVWKKDGNWQLCVQYQRLNSVKNFDCFVLPRLDKVLDALAGTTVFSSLNLVITYNQVPVKPSDVEKTVFITHVGLFKIQKMHFGFCNAPSIY